LASIDIIQQSLIDHLKQDSRFTDWNFEGSNLNTLTRLLAYNTLNMNHYNMMVHNESFMDSAILRQSINSHATTLNYLPQSCRSGCYRLDVIVDCPDNPSFITLPKYYKFTGSINNRNYSFVTDSDFLGFKDQVSGLYIFKDVEVFQGDIVEQVIKVSGVSAKNQLIVYDNHFVINSAFIDLTSLNVYVVSNNVETEFKYAQYISELSPSDKVFFLRAIYDNQYALEFGDGVFGSPVKNDDIIKIKYRNVDIFELPHNINLNRTSDIRGYTKISLDNTRKIYDGSVYESHESIRNNAVRSFRSQNRAITKDDYDTIIRTNFPNIEQVYVYGGEQVQQYGKVFISMKYKKTDIVTDIVKNQIISLLKTKNIVIDPVIIDPDIFYLKINADVTYKLNHGINTNQLASDINFSLSELNSSKKTGFGGKLYQSDIIDSIKAASQFITGVSLSLGVVKRWSPQRLEDSNLKINLLNKLVFGYLYSSVFDNFRNGLISVNRFVAEDKRIFLFDVLPNGDLHNTNIPVGSVDYEAGKIEISHSIYDYKAPIDIDVKLHDNSFISNDNKFVIIDPSFVNLNFIAD